MVTNAKRDLLVKYATFLISKAPQIHYLAVRPMPTAHLTYAEAVQKFREGGTISEDCSGTVTLLCKWAGLKDPNGFGYNGFGNSGTMFSHLKSRYTDPKDAHPGAIGVYGQDGDEHAVMVIARNGDNPILFSHGSEIGPLRISLEDESAAHAGQPFTFLDISGL